MFEVIKPACVTADPPWQDSAQVVPSAGDPVFDAGEPVGSEMALGASKLKTLKTANDKNNVSAIFFIKWVLSLINSKIAAKI